MKICKITLSLLILLITLFIGSCDMFVNWFGTTVEGRVDGFNRDLTDGNYSSLYKHFSSDIDDYNTMKNTGSVYWDDTSFWPSSGSYVTIESYSGEDPVTGTLKDGTVSKTFKLYLTQKGLVYYIKRAYVNDVIQVRKLD